MPKQFPLGSLVAVLLTASGLLWAVMFFGPLAHLSRLSGGMMPFDIRPWGYSYAEARAFLEAIGAEGRACWALIAVPILMATLDVIENGCIAVMLWTWPHLSNGVVEISSLATQVKILSGALTETLMAGLAVVWLARLFARRGYD
jgi:hypothetical protein